MTPEQKKYLEKVEKGFTGGDKKENQFLKKAKEWWDFHFGSDRLGKTVSNELDKSSSGSKPDKSDLTKPKKPSK